MFGYSHYLGYFYFVLWILTQISIKKFQKLPLFAFTRPAYVVTLPENVRGKFYTDPIADSKIGVHLPYEFLIGRKSPTVYTNNVDNESNFVRYKIISGDKQNFFKAECHIIGNFAFLRLRTRPSLDLSINRELTPEFRLRIKGTLKRTNERTNLEAFTEVTVRILDENDLSPLFVPQTYKIQVDENTPLYSSLVQVVAKDPDKGLNGEVYYSLQDPSEFFDVNPYTGCISMIKSLQERYLFDSVIYSNTSEQVQTFRLKILAQDRASRLFPPVQTSPNSRIGNTADVEITFRSSAAISYSIYPMEISESCGRNAENLCLLLKVMKNMSFLSDNSLNFVSKEYDQYFTLKLAYSNRSADFYELNSIGELLPGNYELKFQILDISKTFNVVVRDDCPKFELYETLPKFFEVDQCTIDGFVGFVDDKLIDQHENLIFTILNENEYFALNSKNGLLTLKAKTLAKSQNYTFLIKADNLVCKTFESLIYNITIFVKSCNYRLPRFISSTCSSIIANPSALISWNPVIPLCKVEAFDEDSNENGRIFYSIRTKDANVQQIFRIHPENGELSIRNSSILLRHIDEENTQNFVFRITASDYGQFYKLSGEFDVNISLSKEISDVNIVKNDRVTTQYAKNIYLPIFLNESAKVVYINESAQPNHIVTTFEARDADAGAAGFVRYGIISGNENGYFKIDTYTGHLIAHKLLDREKHDYFELKIEARDSGFPETKFEHRSFVIKLLDVNDNRPFFKQSSFVFNIPENSLAGVVVGRVMAIDHDEKENARLTYRLASTSNIFDLEENSGEITVKTPILNREEKDEYKLTIVASDNGRPSLSSSTFVTILISDMNDNVPKIPSLKKRVKLAEDLPLNALISCFDGYDEDFGENGTIVYHLVDDQSQKFSIDRETGCLKLSGKLSFEGKPLHNLTIEMSDKGHPRLSITIYFIVEVIRVNENRFQPKFSKFAYEAEIYENEAIGSHVIDVSATDQDEKSLISYTVVGGDGIGYFGIDSAGKITTKRILDRETKSYYWLTVQASDNDLIPKSNTVEIFIRVLDRNDNKPIPSQASFNASVKENSPGNTVVASVEAIDSDQNFNDHPRSLSFKITKGDPQSFFKIDAKTGVISTYRRQIDRESVSSFELEVSISDKDEPTLSSEVVVWIDVKDTNDNAPKFPSRHNEFKILTYFRNSSEQRPLCRVFAMDEDVSSLQHLSYSIAEGNEDKRFSINPSSGEILLRGSPLKNRETIALTISVSDGQFKDETSVILNVFDVPSAGENLSPHVGRSNLTIHIAQGDHIGRSIGLIEASDEDGDVLGFYFTDGDGTFLLVPDTGEIQIASIPSLPRYVLTFVVTDGLHSISGKLTIICQSPHESEIRFNKDRVEIELFENITVGSSVFKLSDFVECQESQMIDMRYFLVNDFVIENDKKFEIDPRRGIVKLISSLDHETTKSYVIHAEARNKKHRAFMLLHIHIRDINDHKPEFVIKDCEVKIAEGTPIGYNIINLIAADEDSDDAGKLTYKIVGGNDLGVFQINELTGSIKLARQVENSQPEFVLFVKVEDGGQPVLSDFATVRASVVPSLQRKITFKQRSYTFRVFENQCIGSIIGSLSVDATSPVIFNIENNKNILSIHPIHGSLSLASKLTSESARRFETLAKCRDSFGQEDSVSVVVEIFGVNTHHPVFQKIFYEGFIYENANPGPIYVLNDEKERILRVKAVDSDSGMAGSVVYRLSNDNLNTENDYFTIDYLTGAIFAKKSLDFEKQRSYELLVSAEDLGRPKMHSLVPAVVQIHIRNVNDIAPMFLYPEFVASIYLPTPNRITVVQITAKDADSEQASLLYTLHNYRSIFALNSLSGILSVKNNSSLTVGHTAYLNISVTDRKFITFASVKVNMMKFPLFPDFGFAQAEYRAEIWENNATKLDLLHLVVYGLSENEFAYVEIIGGSTDYLNSFKLNPFTGVLSFVGEKLDRESIPGGRLFFLVRGMDSRKPQRIAQCTVDVTVKDQNDFKPIFMNEPYITTVDANYSGKPLLSVEAIDEDSGDNGHISYILGDSREMIGEIIDVNENDGHITASTGFLEYISSKMSLEFTVIARDHGIPSLSATSTVKIFASKTQYLAFEKSSFELFIAEDVVPETVVGVYIVKSNSKNVIGHYIVAGNIDSVFHIDFISGALKVQKPLDREKVAKYALLINATDFSESMSAQSSVEIDISDINDNAPQFRSSFYRFVVSENAIMDSILGKVEAYDLDMGENSTISYSIDDHTTILHIDQSSGKLYLKQPLDYETVKEYYLNVSAFDSGRPSLLTKALVIILVQDVNDNCPKFTKLAYEATIFDDVPFDAFVTQVFAEDIDVTDSSKLRFQILDVSHENHNKQNAETWQFDGNQDYIRELFSIDEKNGAIKKKSPSPTLLPVNNIFDPFKISGSKFTLNVTVTDGLYASSCLVTVNVRHSATSLHKDKDMKRIFDFKIKENIDVGSTLGILDPSPMSSFEYQLLNSGNIFEIEKYAGNLVVTSKLNADVRDQYQLSVLVKSTMENDKSTYPIQAKLTIYCVNDNRPIFSVQNIAVSVSADLVPDSLILTAFASDMDRNDIVEYAIRRRDLGYGASNYFKIDHSSGQLHVKSNLVDLAGRIIKFVITATDQGNPPLHDELSVEISVEKRIPESFIFSQSIYEFSVSENAVLGQKIGQVSASDGLKVDYSCKILSSDQQRFEFLIDSDGWISINKILDRETRQNYDFYVGASNQRDSNKILALSLIKIQILDVNDEEPKFSVDKVKAFVFEDSPIDFNVVLLLAEDRDQGSAGSIRYYFANETQQAQKGYFKIDPYSGLVSVARALDREIQEAYELSVLAVDQGNPSLESKMILEIQILDVNDQPPHLQNSSYNFIVNENISLGTVIGHMNVKDDDLYPSNKTKFYIINGNMRSTFGINDNGALFLNRALNFKEKSQHALTILVTDGKFSSTAHVQLQIEAGDHFDFDCITELIVYVDISEDATIGAEIFTWPSEIGNLDLTSILNLVGSPDFGLLSNGSVVVKRPLDREVKDFYNLSLKTLNIDQHYCQIDIKVTILDVNDQFPVIHNQQPEFSLLENSPGPFPVFLTQIRAVDVDLGNNGSIGFTIKRGKVDEISNFFIHKDSGALLCTEPLDREEVEKYELIIVASDSGDKKSLFSEIRLTLNVLDVRDSPPYFTRKSYSVEIYENTTVGQHILTVEALSKDSDGLQCIRYKIIEEGAEIFEIDSLSGALKLKASVDFETKTRYSFAVMAYNVEQAELLTTANVNISILNVNDNPPEFNQSSYKIHVKENQLVGSVIVHIAAKDEDSPIYEHLKYEILDENEPLSASSRPTFAVDNSGSILLAKALDYEMKRTYEFTLKAKDSGLPPLFGSTRVYVEVLDVNDNSPIIQNCNRTIHAKGSMKSGTEIFSLQVVDKDGPENGAPFSFELSGKRSLDFSISDNGIIYWNKESFAQSLYDIKITVSDKGVPSLSSTCHLGVKITEESKFAPEVTSFRTTMMTYYGEFHGGMVGRIHATDKDPHDKLSFSIQFMDHKVHTSLETTRRRKDDDYLKELFAIHPDEGTISAAAGLPVGEYKLNISAHDGTFHGSAEASFEVKKITNDMLSASLVAELSDIDAHAFVRSKTSAFVGSLANSLGVRHQYVYLLSVQDRYPIDSSSLTSEVLPRIVDVLFAIKKSHTEWHKPEQLRDRLVNRLLNSYVATKKNSTDDLKISRLMLETCRKDTCVHGDCRDLLTLDDMNMVAIFTSSSNFVSPRHKKSPECICHEGYGGLICDKVLNACHIKPCPVSQICIPDDSPKGYSCSCPPATSGSDCRETINCLRDSICAESVLNFDGQSFVKYTLWKSLSVEMELSLQFRTTSPFGTLMFSSGTNDFHSLEIHASILQYRIDLGSGENFLSIKQTSVTDGQWHRVKIVRKQKNISLQLDNHKKVEHTISGAGIVLNLYGDYLYLGSEVWNPNLDLRSSKTRNKRTASFRGCISSVELNGYALTTMGNDVSMRNVKFGCTSNEDFRLSPDSPDPCASVTCQNGGTCFSSSATSFFCQCPHRFEGLFCEKSPSSLEACPSGAGTNCLEASKNNLCSSNPCKHEGLCVLTAKNDDFMCNCTIGWSGQYCDVAFSLIPNITAAKNWSSIWPELVTTVGLLLALILICLFLIAICKRRNRFRYIKRNYIQNVANDEITCDLLHANACHRQSRRSASAMGGGSSSAKRSHPCSPIVYPRPIAVFNDANKPPPPLPPRLRCPKRQNLLLSNLESAKSTGIPTVQVRPLSMNVDRVAASSVIGLPLGQSAADYGSAAEELEKMGTGRSVCDPDDDFDVGNGLSPSEPKSGTLNYDFNQACSSENNKNLSSRFGKKKHFRRKTVDSIAAQSVTSIQCLPEDEHSSIYQWDYSDWHNTLAPTPAPLPRDYNSATIDKSQISILATDNNNDHHSDDELLTKCISKFEETDAEDNDDDRAMIDSFIDEQDEDKKDQTDQFRRQLIALSQLNEGLDKFDGDENRLSAASSKNDKSSGGSYLDRYLPRFNDVLEQNQHITVEDNIHFCVVLPVSQLFNQISLNMDFDLVLGTSSFGTEVNSGTELHPVEPIVQTPSSAGSERRRSSGLKKATENNVSGNNDDNVSEWSALMGLAISGRNSRAPMIQNDFVGSATKVCEIVDDDDDEDGGK